MVEVVETKEKVVYDAQRHIEYRETLRLTGFSDNALESAIKNHGNGVRIYNSGSLKFLDRLDLGRVLHYMNGNGKINGEIERGR